MCDGWKRMMGQGWYTPPRPSFDLETGQGSPYFVYTYSTQMAEVEVDIKTGAVDVLKVVGDLRYREGDQTP